MTGGIVSPRNELRKAAAVVGLVATGPDILGKSGMSTAKHEVWRLLHNGRELARAIMPKSQEPLPPSVRAEVDAVFLPYLTGRSDSRQQLPDPADLASRQLIVRVTFEEPWWVGVLVGVPGVAVQGKEPTGLHWEAEWALRALLGLRVGDGVKFRIQKELSVPENVLALMSGALRLRDSCLRAQRRYADARRQAIDAFDALYGEDNAPPAEWLDFPSRVPPWSRLGERYEPADLVARQRVGEDCPGIRATTLPCGDSRRYRTP
jgi:hypothetical protein